VRGFTARHCTGEGLVLHLLRGIFAISGMVCFSRGLMEVDIGTTFAIALFAGLLCGVSSYAGSKDNG